MDLNCLKSLFLEKYSRTSEPIHSYFAPGRVNLIGEHTDYNGGYVLPCALSFGTYLLIRKNGVNVFRFASENFSYSCTVPTREIGIKHENNWVNYPLGILHQLQQELPEDSGIDFLFYGDIPNGAGLSSSASIELVTAYALNDLFSLHLSRKELAQIGQRAENEFVGMNCGIMDQFAVAMGKKNSALFLNCDTLEYSLVPIQIDGYKIVITNTNKQRKLTDSKYNERRSECQAAMEAINAGGHAFKDLGELSTNQFEKHKHLIANEIIRNRAKHVVTENTRVVNAVAALKENHLERFGELMYESHTSLRYDYEVTCAELDILVEEAQKCEGVIGSRMTGAGFGGCTVSIVAESKINEFKAKVGDRYQSKTGLKADFYIAEIGDGVYKMQ